MNNGAYRKNIPIIANSPGEYEAFVKYIQAKYDDKSWTFTFNISAKDKDGNKKIKIAITEHIT